MKPTLLIICALGLMAYATRVSDADIQKCIETTNYSAERCLQEITK